MRFRIFKIMTLVAVLFAVAGIVAGAWYISYLNHMVTAKFHDPKASEPFLE